MQVYVERNLNLGRLHVCTGPQQQTWLWLVGGLNDITRDQDVLLDVRGSKKVFSLTIRLLQDVRYKICFMCMMESGDRKLELLGQLHSFLVSD